MFGKRILILVPHPDDEIVACAAAIGRAQAAGAAIYALYLTQGCLARETLWPWQRRHYEGFVARRRAEAEEVARFLGLTPAGWSPRAARHLWQEMPQVYAEIQAAISAHGIDQLWVPAYEGGNPDHDATSAIAQLFRDELSVFEFAEYNFKDGSAHSQAFPFPNGTEHLLHLTPEEQAKKLKALKLYASESLNLNYVKAERESFRPLAIYDYAKPPHEGTLWYARFQWVPFRHPQVDFTNPADICRTIVSFHEQANTTLRIKAN